MEKENNIKIKEELRKGNTRMLGKLPRETQIQLLQEIQREEQRIEGYLTSKSKIGEIENSIKILTELIKQDEKNIKKLSRENRIATFDVRKMRLEMEDANRTKFHELEERESEQTKKIEENKKEINKTVKNVISSRMELLSLKGKLLVAHSKAIMEKSAMIRELKLEKYIDEAEKEELKIKVNEYRNDQKMLNALKETEILKQLEKIENMNIEPKSDLGKATKSFISKWNKDNKGNRIKIDKIFEIAKMNQEGFNLEEMANILEKRIEELTEDDLTEENIVTEENIKEEVIKTETESVKEENIKEEIAKEENIKEGNEKPSKKISFFEKIKNLKNIKTNIVNKIKGWYNTKNIKLITEGKEEEEDEEPSEEAMKIVKQLAKEKVKEDIENAKIKIKSNNDAIKNIKKLKIPLLPSPAEMIPSESN